MYICSTDEVVTDKGCGHRLLLWLTFSWIPSHPLTPAQQPSSHPAQSLQHPPMPSCCLAPVLLCLAACAVGPHAWIWLCIHESTKQSTAASPPHPCWVLQASLLAPRAPPAGVQHGGYLLWCSAGLTISPSQGLGSRPCSCQARVFPCHFCIPALALHVPLPAKHCHWVTNPWAAMHCSSICVPHKAGRSPSEEGEVLFPSVAQGKEEESPCGLHWLSLWRQQCFSQSCINGCVPALTAGCWCLLGHKASVL